MPTDEHSRAEYLRSLLNQQRNINANGGNLLNPAVPNTGGSLGAAAMMDTSFQGGGINSDVLSYDPEKDVKEKNWFESAVDKIFGFADEITSQFGAGFIGAFEGILDLAATGLGALGDATGWYSSDPFANWAKKDLGQDAATYIKTFWTPWGDIRNMINGNYWTEDYWRGRWQGAANMLTLGNAYAGEYDPDGEHDRYYGFNDNLDTGLGQFLGGAAHSIGFMLPSILTGGVAAGAGATSAVAQGVSLASMGVSAAGKGGEEALNEGASAGQALAYGAASGAVEVVSEIVVGKALGLVGLGTGKVMGVVGKGAGAKTASVGSKTFVKELIKTMNEEGAEEIFSAVMEPLTKAIYTGKVDADSTYKSADWWFGTNGKFNESVLGQYAAGAFVGGLSGGVQNSSVYKKVGKNGYQLVAESRNVAEAINGLQKAEQGSPKYAKAEQRFGEAMSSFIKAENTFLESATKEQKIEIAKVFNSPNNMKAFTEALQAADVDASVSDYIKKYTENISTADKAVSYNFLSQMQRKYGTDVELRFDESIKANGQYDAGTNTIALNPKVLSTKGGKVLAHEYFGHALSANMSPGARAQFYQQIKALDPSLVKQVEDTYKELDKSSPKMREEVISHFLERYFDDSNISKQLDKVNKAFGDMTLKERILQAFDKTAKQQNGRAIIKEYGRVLREFLRKSGDKTLLKAAAKSVLNQRLTESERKAAKQYPSVFDALKDSMTNRQAQGVFASEELVSSVDSNGNRLSEEQIEFFKDSKIRDEDGNLLVVYHGTPNQGFTVFDSKSHVVAGGGASADASSVHHGRDVNWFVRDEAIARTYTRPETYFQNFQTVEEVIDEANRILDHEDYGEFKANDAYVKISDELLKRYPTPDKYDHLLSNPFARSRGEVQFSDSPKEGYTKVIKVTAEGNQDWSAPRYFADLSSLKESIANWLSNWAIDYNERGNATYRAALERRQTYQVYLNITNPMIVDAQGSNWDDVLSEQGEEGVKTRDLVERAIEKGYDGLIIKNVTDIGPNSDDSIYDFESYASTVYVTLDSANQIKSIDNKNPTQNPDIYLSKDLAEDYDKHPEKDPEGYIRAEGGTKLGLTNHLEEAIQSLSDEGNSASDFLVGETDYRDGYISKRFVNRMNANADAVLTAIENKYGDDFSDLERWLEDYSDEEYEDFIKFAENNADEGTIDGLQTIIDEVDNSEYPNDEPPDYEYVQNLIDRLSEMNEAAENWPSEYKLRKELSQLPEGDWRMAFFHEKGTTETQSRLYPEGTETDQIKDDMAGNGMVLDAIYNNEYKEVGTYSKYAYGQESTYYDEIIRMNHDGEIKVEEEPAQEQAAEQETVEQPKMEVKNDDNGFIVNEDGKREEFYHGSKTGDASHLGFGDFGAGYYFSTSEQYANDIAGNKGSVVKANIKMQNPLVFRDTQDYDDFVGKYFDEAEKKFGKDWHKDNPRAVIDMLKADGYDGIVITDPAASASIDGMRFYIAFDSEQVAKVLSPEEIAEKYNGEATLATRETTNDFSEDDRKEYAELRAVATELSMKDSNKPWKTKVKTRGVEKLVNIAPYYMANVSSAEDYRKFRENFKHAQNMLAKIARDHGCDFIVHESFGVYRNKADNFFQDEPSFVVSLGKVDMETANYVASLFADLGFQQQEASISSRVARTIDEWKKIKNADDRVVRFEIHFDQYVIKPHEVSLMFQQRGIECTVRADGIVHILDFKNDYQSREEIEKTIEGYREIYDILKERNAVHGQAFKKAIRYDLVESRWLGKDSRRELYEERSGRSDEAGLGVAEESSSETGRPVLTTPPAPAPAPKAAVKQYYKSIETTRDIVTATGDLIVDSINNGGASDYRIVYPDDFRDTSSVGMTRINSVKDTAKEAHRLMDVMAETYIEERNPDGTYTTLGTVADIINPAVLTSLEPYVEDIIKSAPDTEARSRATRSLEMQLNRALDKNRDLKNKVVRTRVLTNQRNAIKGMVDRYVEITDEVRAKEGLYTLLQPFGELHGSSSDAFQRRGFKGNLKAALEWYTEENMSDPEKWVGIPFDPEVRQALINVYESLGESERGSLSTETMRLSSKAITLIRQLIRKMQADYIVRIRPGVDQTYAAIQASGYRKNMNVVAKLYRMYKRGFAPAYVILNQMLGENSVLARKLTFEMQAKLNDAQLYRGAYGDLINKKLKELGLKKTFDRKRFAVNGKSLSADQAMFLWNALSTKANFDAINDAGITYYDENNNLAKVSEVGNAQALKDELERVLPENYRKMAEFLLDTMNGSVKSEYMKMYEDRYGKYEHRNEIGKVGDRSYWMLFRSYERITNTEKAVKNPAGMFSHALKRVNNENAVLIAGALSSFTAYTDQLSREMFVKPTYREALAMLNSKGSAGQNVAMLLRQKVDEQDYHYLTTTLSDILGANPFDKGNDVFSRAMSAFSVAKLSLNVGTMLKQFASIWTSNIPMNKSFKGVFSNIFKSPAVKSEYRALVDELGGLKYRESGKGVVLANADSAGALTQKIANAGMVGISKVDLFTVSSGVVSLMHIAKDQFGYEIGTEENKNWVKEHWTEFELSQIGGGALSKNAIQRGDFKQLPRLLFGFMQGANRAALGSQLNQIGLLKRNYGADVKKLRQDKADAKTARDAAKTAYDAKTDDKALAQAYMEAESRYLDAEAKLNDYERFIAAGGKAIPVHMAAGLVAQGLFVALINELMKHIRGKKDKDDWEFVKDPLLWLLNTAKTIGLDWLPFVNAITSALLGSFERDKNGNIVVGDGYELSVPVVEMGNALIDIFNGIKNGNPNIWNIATLAGDMLGIPADLIKDYVRGAIRWFDPATADKLQNVLYGSSLQSATKSYQSFLDKGDSKSAKSMLKSMFAQYKTGYVSDNVADRIVKLEMNGYDVDVKSMMTAYTGADGSRAQLNAKQINAFKEAYSRSDKAVLELMSTGEFQSSTQEEQAALIKKIYDSYYAYAKAKVTGQADTKVSALLAGTNGTVAVGRFIAMLSKISTIKANKVKSRKELVFDFLKGKGLSKGEQTLILYLAGYGLNDNSKRTLSAFLLAKGMARDSIADFLGK